LDPRSPNNRKQIFEYWNNRNKSKVYSKKLNKLFIQTLKLSLKFPKSGALTEIDNVRAKVVKDYLVVYEITEDFLIVLAIWNTYQHPEKFKEVLKSIR